MADQHTVLFITAPNPQEGLKIAEALVAEKLAACVNVVEKVTSIYWWQGKVERDAEALLIVKTKSSLVEALTARVKQLHSYTVPEVIALPIERGNPDYLKWIDEVTK